MVKLLLIPLVLYLAIAALMYLGQRSLLYLPSHRGATPAALEAACLRRWSAAAANERTAGETGEEADYRGYLFEPPSATATIVLFHGNAGEAIDRTHYVEALRFLGARVLLAEYPGYGTRAGAVSETALLADARETLLRVRTAFPDEPLHVVGVSLGAGVAAGAVGSDRLDLPPPPVDSLVLLTPWNTLASVAAHHYRFLPVEWLLRDRYPSDRHLEGVRVPKAVVLAERDEVVPARFGRALFETLPEPKALLVVDGATHNDWLGRVDEGWWRALWARVGVRR